MKHLLLSVFFTLTVLFASSQKEANVWYFGFGAGMDFNSGSPVALTNGAMGTNEGCASIADKTTGQLLFYTDGTSIWNKNNTVMPNGNGLGGNPSSTQSAVIVPQPGSNTLFYVFTVDAQVGLYSGNKGRFNYNIVDITLNGGLGDVSTLNQQLTDSMTEKIAATKHCNGHDIWVIGHRWNSDAFYAWLLTNTGIAAPVISHAGIVHQNAGSNINGEAIGYMKSSPDGTKIAVACYEQLNTVQVLDFDNSTGIVSNPIFTDTNFPNSSGADGPYGASFSPDNSRLYISVYRSVGSEVYQYNMLAGNSAAILASRIQVNPLPVTGFGAIQIGPDHKMYVTRGGISYLAAINNPNALGLACSYKDSAVYLGAGHTAALGLPDMVENFTSSYSSSLIYSGCSGSDTLLFTDPSMTGTVSSYWNFGDPASGTSDTSTFQNPTHTFTSSGNHTVTLYLSNACITDTITQTVNVSSSGLVTAYPADTAVCFGNPVQLTASGGTTYKWSPGASLSDSTIANPVAAPMATTTYTVTVSPAPCADSTATVVVTVYPSPSTPVITRANDTLYCTTDSSYKLYQWYYNDTLIANATDTFYIPTKSGNYNLAVTDVNGCLISVGINITVGLNNYISDNKIFMSPNPARDKITIYGLQFTIRRVEIYNMVGQLCQQSEIINPKSEIEVEIASLPSGIYFVSTVGEKEGWVGRFVKE